MKIVALIAEQTALAGLEFLIIGGKCRHRPAHDGGCGLLVREADRRKWDEPITALGYRPHHLQRIFHMDNPIGENRTGEDLKAKNVEPSVR